MCLDYKLVADALTLLRPPSKSPSMSSTPCYHCKSSDSEFYASENSFDLVRCCECGLLFVDPAPNQEQITQAHHVGVHQGDAQVDVTGCFEARKVKAYGKILKDLFGNELASKKRRWLDIGCGHGEFIESLHLSSGNQVSAIGLEPNVKKQASAHARGLDVSDFDLNTHAPKYDTLSFLNVWSHLPDPPSIIKSWCDRLKPGGELLLQTGDTAHLSAEQHYRPFFLPDHLSFASRTIVCEVLESLHFDIVEVRQYPFREASLPNIGKEIIKAFLPNRTSHLRYMFGEVYKTTNMYVLAKRRL